MVKGYDLPASTPVWINNAYPGIKVGTPAVTVTACKRDRHNESVTVRLENGKERQVVSLSLSEMLAEEIPAWATDGPTPAAPTSQGGN